MIAFRAPGRVNLIGEHVDYAGGLVLPAAIDRGVTLTGESTDDGLVRIESRGFGDVAEIAVDAPHAEDGWARYVAAVVAELANVGVTLPGYRGVLESDLPAGAGLSSSAALEVALAGGMAAACGMRLEGLDLALVAWRAEPRAVGVPCGIMDQAASVLGQAGSALLLDCETLGHRPVPLPGGTALLILDSGVRRALEHSAYALRRDEVSRALAVLPAGAAREWEPERVLRHARAAGLDDVAWRRLRHVVTERARVERVVGALDADDESWRASLQEVFMEGHASLRDDFEVTVPELDDLVRLAVEEGAYGARMTGAGFGGAVVAVVPAGTAEAIGERVLDRFPGRGAALVTTAAAGATIVSHDAGKHTEAN